MPTIGHLASSVFVGTALLLSSTPALSQPQEIVVTGKVKVPAGFEPVEKVVRINDINLATSAGAKEMNRRVGAAIKSICEPPARPARWQVRDSKACSDFAWADARPKMDLALKNARGG